MEAQIAWQDLVRQQSPLAEKQGRLTPEMLSLAYSKNWFKLFVPVCYGGAGKQLPEILRLEEQLAMLDGSLGWTVTLCSGAGWFAGFLDGDLANELFADPKVCFAGSGAIGGTAQKSADGYIINGHWKYASGAMHATVFTANCLLLDEEGNEQLDQDGNAAVKSFILKRDEVEIVAGWAYFGLVATGSHAFVVRHCKVPKNRMFQINQAIKVADVGFEYPFTQLAETTLAVNNLGMAQHFINLVDEYFYKRSGLKRFSAAQIASFENDFNGRKKVLSDCKVRFYSAFDASWRAFVVKKQPATSELDAVSLASREIVHLAWETVQKLYIYCGLEAAKKETELNRVWRDIHTASQHALFTFK